MKVIALKSFVAEIGGRTIHAEEGQELEVDAAILAGIHRLVKTVKPNAGKSGPETASLEAPENESMPKATRRKKA